MDKTKKTLGIVSHIALWAILFTLHSLLAKGAPFRLDTTHHIIITIIYATVFYINFFFLMPLLFKKKFIWFIVISVVLLTSAITLKSTISSKNFRERMELYEIFRPSMDEHFHNRYQGRYAGRKPGPPFGRKIVFELYGILLVYGASFSFRFITKWQHDEALKKDLENEKIKTELNFLKQQINPHFLFNSLNSIYSLSLTNSPETTESILKLSSILRYVLYKSNKSEILLQNEFEIIKDYIDLQKLRLTDNVKINLDIKGDAKDYKIESFILIPIIENAFKYGTDNVLNSDISVIVEIINSKLHARVSNTIIPTIPENNEDKGIGLQNINRRLELLYPNEYKFEIIKLDDLFSVVIELTLNK